MRPTEEFRKPDSYIRGLISIESLTRGFDVPDVEVLILARPLRRALAVHIQMLGRVLRCSKDTGKTEAIVLDHSGNCMRFWSQVEDFFENGIDELDDGKPKEAKPAAEKKETQPVKCPTCFQVHSPLPACPSCGYVYSTSKEILRVAGTLQEVKGAKSKKVAPTAEQRASFYAQLHYIALEKAWKPGAAAWKFREKFGDWPTVHDKAMPAVEPTQEVLNWLLSRRIAGNAKAKKA